MNNSEGGYVYFGILPQAANVVWKDYRYGFYYSVEDKPIEIYTGNSAANNTKVYWELVSFIKYWYRTERITDNW